MKRTKPPDGGFSVGLMAICIFMLAKSEKEVKSKRRTALLFFMVCSCLNTLP